MFDLNDLYYFVKVVDHGGFAPASRAVGASKSTLSRRIAQLEERLGVRLIQRSTRRFHVTDLGQTYYEHCKAMIVEAEAAQEAIDSLQAEPRGVVRMTCPIALLNAHVGEMVADYMTEYPEVTVQLEATNRRVDVITEGIDIALRARPLPLEDTDLTARMLSDEGQCLVGSPSLIEARGRPSEPSELTQWPSLWHGRPEDSFQWHLFGPTDRETVVEHKPRYVTTDMVALRRAALAGVGIVQLPILMLREQMAEGTLVRLLPQWAPRREMVHAVFPSRRGLLPAVRAMIDFLVERYRGLRKEPHNYALSTR